MTSTADDSAEHVSVNLHFSFCQALYGAQGDDQSTIPGTCVQYNGLQGGDALGDASTPGTPADSIAASAHGGTYSTYPI